MYDKIHYKLKKKKKKKKCSVLSTKGVTQKRDTGGEQQVFPKIHKAFQEVEMIAEIHNSVDELKNKIDMASSQIRIHKKT